jgi:peptidoglycan hydrolase CwlO-like protein
MVQKTMNYALHVVQEEYESRLNQLGEMVSELQKYMDQIEDMQGELDDRSLKNAGGAGPTTRARQAISSLQDELKQMEVKLGVARQQLLHLDHKCQTHHA